MKFLIRIKKAICDFRLHPKRRICSGPWNGYWTVYCPYCDEYWDEPVDGTMPRD